MYPGFKPIASVSYRRDQGGGANCVERIQARWADSGAVADPNPSISAVVRHIPTPESVELVMTGACGRQDIKEQLRALTLHTFRWLFVRAPCPGRRNAGVVVAGLY